LYNIDDIPLSAARRFNRPAEEGGDGWGRRAALDLLTEYEYLIANDLSLEHGGTFPPVPPATEGHSSHKAGTSIDTRYLGSDWGTSINLDGLNGRSGDSGAEGRRVMLTQAQNNVPGYRRAVVDWIEDNRRRMDELLSDARVRLIYVGHGTRL